jgi:hypothetical protein
VERRAAPDRLRPRDVAPDLPAPVRERAPAPRRVRDAPRDRDEPRERDEALERDEPRDRDEPERAAPRPREEPRLREDPARERVEPPDREDPERRLELPERDREPERDRPPDREDPPRRLDPPRREDPPPERDDPPRDRDDPERDPPELLRVAMTSSLGEEESDRTDLRATVTERTRHASGNCAARTVSARRVRASAGRIPGLAGDAARRAVPASPRRGHGHCPLPPGSGKPCLPSPARGILHGWSGIRRARDGWGRSGPVSNPWPPTG